MKKGRRVLLLSEARREVERQKGLVSFAKKSASDVVNNVASLRKRVAVSDKREMELLDNVLASSGQIARATTELL